MKELLTVFLLIFSSLLYSQDYNSKTRNIIGTFHAENTTINGMSFGVFTKNPFNNYSTIEKKEYRFVKTNGIRLELPGTGYFGFLFFDNLIRDTIISGEIINGMNFSLGTIGDVEYNGITTAVFSQSGVKNNGIAVAIISNTMNISNGVQLSLILNETVKAKGVQLAILGNGSEILNGFQLGFFNSAEKLNGVQIGFFNKSTDVKGVQIGLWCVNQKRKLPFFNWSFKK